MTQRADWGAAWRMARAPGARAISGLGLGLGVALIVVFYGLLLASESGRPPDDRLFPLATGERLALGDLLSGVSMLYMLGVSILMMVPVASVFSWLFFDDLARIADRGEAPPLPPATPLTRWEAFVANANFFGLLAALNILALIHVYPVIGLATPVVFWLLNGVLLGKEYTQLALRRRLPARVAQSLWWRNFWPATARGVVFAVALTVPVANLGAPVLGALVFTRLGNRIFRAPR
jgi:uncharacterized protein involved in cysteine biosynthesis